MSRLVEVFSEASDLPDDERQAFLDRACADDPTLRAEVESLLAYHQPDSVTDVSKGGGARSQGPPVAPTASWLSTRRSRRRLALGAGVGAALCLTVGLMTHELLLTRLRGDTTVRLEATVDTAANGYRGWIGEWRETTEGLASNRDVIRLVRPLATATLGREVDAATTAAMEPHRELESLLRPLALRDQVINVNVFNRENLAIFFADPATMKGVHRLSSRGAELVAPIFSGETIVTPPQSLGENVAGAHGADGPPQVAVGAPVYGEDEEVVAILTVRLRSEPAITELMRASSEEDVDVYAFDRRGLMVSRSRREAVLHRAGLLPEDRIASLRVWVRDPGRSLADGVAPAESPEVWPPTRLVLRALAGSGGRDLEGYRDYTGRVVLGAWRWLPDHGVGIAAEIGRDDAYAPLGWTKVVFGGATLLLALIALRGASTAWAFGKRERVVLGAQLGQYRLEKTIGAGGMARVYRARHERLPRPMALKILEGEATGPEARARFEREVRLVSRLRHPNTVQVFDYGQDTRGRLFFVMELVDGIDLGELVRATGPVPPGRAIKILRQVCASLQEAHDLGIVHRDIKPANIMVGQRAGHADVVTVLDFGLARTTAKDATQLTQQHVLGGTPAYIAPERIHDPSRVDARSDVYAIGAVGYFMLTGREVVEGSTPHEVLLQAMHSTPEPPSRRAPHPVPEGLDALVLQCLGQDLDARPADAGALAEPLEAMAEACPFSEESSRRWWDEYRSAPPEQVV